MPTPSAIAASSSGWRSGRRTWAIQRRHRIDGSPRKWKVGGPKNEADIVLILASDHVSVLDDLVDLLKLRAATRPSS